MTRISFTGTRTGMKPRQLSAFSALVESLLSAELENEWHDGDCIGADDQAHRTVESIRLRLLRDRGVEAPRTRMIGHPCNLADQRASNVFDETCVIKDPLTRNRDMVDEAEILVATPGGWEEEARSGTWATIRYARRQINAGQNLVIIIIWPNGTYTKEP